MDLLKTALVSQLLSSPPPTPPPFEPPSPPPYFVEDNVPDILTFLGTTVYGVSFSLAVTDFLELQGRGDLDDGYASRPVHMVAGLLVGLVSYGFAFMTSVELASAGHSVLSTVVFFCFAKHLMRRLEMPSRRTSSLITIGVLPLLCLAVLEAGRVKVRSARFFFALMLILAAMPLPHLFRQWLPGSAGASALDPSGGKLRKRLFCLFFFAFCYVAASTPARAAAGARVRVGDARQSAVACFDLLMVYYALDGLWNGGGGDHA